MQNNLHIVMNAFSHGSRILKETSSLTQSGVVQRVYIAAVHEKGLEEHERIDEYRSIWRVRLRTRHWSRCFIAQLTKYIEFSVKLTCFSRKRNITVVTIHHLALLPLGFLLKQVCGAKLVYDAHELETETYGLTEFRQRVARHVERVFIKYADLVMVVSDSIREWYRNEYELSNIITVLNCPQYQEPRRTRRLHEELGIPSDRKILIYQGGLVKGRGVERLLNVFSKYDDSSHVLVFMGYGELESLVEDFAKLHSNIYLQRAVPPSMVLQYTASADIGISYIDNPSLNDHFCLPNKLFEYMMAGLAVIVNNVPEQRRVVSEGNIGIVLEELTVESVIGALEELAHVDSEVLSKRISQTAKLYSWENQSASMLDAHKQYVFSKTEGANNKMGECYVSQE